MNNLGTELLKTCDLRSENAEEYFYSYVVYVNLVSSSRLQPLLHGDENGGFGGPPALGTGNGQF